MNRFNDLRKHSTIFKYILQSDIKDSYKIDKTYFAFLNIDYIDIEQIEFSNSEIWKLKFQNAREEIMKNEENNVDIITRT